MKIILLFLFTFSFGFYFAQDTVFLDAKWIPSSKANAEYFRIKKKEGDKWRRTDYFAKTKQVQMTGTYISLTPAIQDGYFEWYYANGKLKHKGNYVNDKQVGEHLWYIENGNIEAKENYKNGELEGLYEEYYPNGKLTLKTSFADGLQEGWTAYYREDGSKHSEGSFKAGNRNGEWKYYDINGNIEGITTFKIDYEIPEAKLFLKLPNDSWSLTEHSASDNFVYYIFKRDEIEDAHGRAIVPAIMLFVDDAESYNQDLAVYYIQKQQQFSKMNFQINNKILIPTDKDFPFPSVSNAMLVTASYSDKGLDHIFYMLYMITEGDIGVQIYMDMTKDIADEYEQEFWTTLKSIEITK